MSHLWHKRLKFLFKYFWPDRVYPINYPHTYSEGFTLNSIINFPLRTSDATIVMTSLTTLYEYMNNVTKIAGYIDNYVAVHTRDWCERELVHVSPPISHLQSNSYFKLTEYIKYNAIIVPTHSSFSPSIDVCPPRLVLIFAKS